MLRPILVIRINHISHNIKQEWDSTQQRHELFSTQRFSEIGFNKPQIHIEGPILQASPGVGFNPLSMGAGFNPSPYLVS